MTGISVGTLSVALPSTNSSADTPSAVSDSFAIPTDTLSVASTFASSSVGPPCSGSASSGSTAFIPNVSLSPTDSSAFNPIAATTLPSSSAGTPGAASASVRISEGCPSVGLALTDIFAGTPSANSSLASVPAGAYSGVSALTGSSADTVSPVECHLLPCTISDRGVVDTALSSFFSSLGKWELVLSQDVQYKYFIDRPVVPGTQFNYRFPGADVPLYLPDAAISSLLQLANNVGRRFGIKEKFDVVGAAHFVSDRSRLPPHRDGDVHCSDPDKLVLSLSWEVDCTFLLRGDSFSLRAGTWMLFSGAWSHGVLPGCKGRVSFTFRRWDRVPHHPTLPSRAGVGR